MKLYNTKNYTQRCSKVKKVQIKQHSICGQCADRLTVNFILIKNYHGKTLRGHKIVFIVRNDKFSNVL